MATDENMKVRSETVHFSGHVQGVGFRYSALQVAKEFEVSGFVQNLPDGRVALQAEGEASEVENFISAVCERMHGYIRKVERSSLEKTPTFKGFTIR